MLATVSVGHVVKWSQRGVDNLVMIGAVSYGVGVVLIAAIALAGGSKGLTPLAIGFVTTAGLSYGIAYVVYLRVVRLFVLGITPTVASMYPIIGVTPIVSKAFQESVLSVAQLVFVAT